MSLASQARIRCRWRVSSLLNMISIVDFGFTIFSEEMCRVVRQRCVRPNRVWRSPTRLSKFSLDAACLTANWSLVTARCCNVRYHCSLLSSPTGLRTVAHICFPFRSHTVFSILLSVKVSYPRFQFVPIPDVK